jgi:hypothetical protein
LKVHNTGFESLNFGTKARLPQPQGI